LTYSREKVESPAMTAKAQKNKGVVGAYLPADLRRRAERLGARKVWSLSRILRLALEDYLDREDRKERRRRTATRRNAA